MLLQVAMQQAATDPATGAIDMDAIYTGITASDRRAQDHLAKEIKDMLMRKLSHSALYVRYTVATELEVKWPWAVLHTILAQIAMVCCCYWTKLQFMFEA